MTTRRYSRKPAGRTPHQEDMPRLPGIEYHIPTYGWTLVRDGELGPLPMARLTEPDHAADVIQRWIGDRGREAFVVLHLSTRMNIIAAELVATGTLNGALAGPREVFASAVVRHAAGIIVGHNHPSGDPTPSRDDLLLTKRLKEAGEILGIGLLDHVIVSPVMGRWVSLKAKGIL